MLRVRDLIRRLQLVPEDSEVIVRDAFGILREFNEIIDNDESAHQVVLAYKTE